MEEVLENLVVEKEDKTPIFDKKVAVVTPNSKGVDKDKFGMAASFGDEKISQIRDDTYLCCSCSCGSATFEKE